MASRGAAERAEKFTADQKSPRIRVSGCKSTVPVMRRNNAVQPEMDADGERVLRDLCPSVFICGSCLNHSG
jgi:hypothetical protein